MLLLKPARLPAFRRHPKHERRWSRQFELPASRAQPARLDTGTTRFSMRIADRANPRDGRATLGFASPGVALPPHDGLSVTNCSIGSPELELFVA